MTQSINLIPERMLSLPGYTVQKLIGRGAMAAVYLALQNSLERPVALKIMAESATADTQFGERFIKEGKIVAQLHHPHIVTIYDIGVHEDAYFMTMEYVAGGTLVDRMQRGLSSDQAMAIFVQVAEALGYAHQRGFVHRDVKPANILFRRDQDAVLSDFGIAKSIRNEGTQLTAVGWTVGTPNYMSPEQALGQAVDGRSDLYSLGVVLYEMLTTERPYQGTDPFSTALLHVSAPIPRLPASLSRYQPLLDQLLAKSPADRPARAEEVLAACESLWHPPVRDYTVRRSKARMSSSAPSSPASSPTLRAGVERNVKKDVKSVTGVHQRVTGVQSSPNTDGQDRTGTLEAMAASLVWMPASVWMGGLSAVAGILMAIAFYAAMRMFLPMPLPDAVPSLPSTAVTTAAAPVAAPSLPIPAAPRTEPVGALPPTVVESPAESPSVSSASLTAFTASAASTASAVSIPISIPTASLSTGTSNASHSTPAMSAPVGTPGSPALPSQPASQPVAVTAPSPLPSLPSPPVLSPSPALSSVISPVQTPPFTPSPPITPSAPAVKQQAPPVKAPPVKASSVKASSVQPKKSPKPAAAKPVEPPSSQPSLTPPSSPRKSTAQPAPKNRVKPPRERSATPNPSAPAHSEPKKSSKPKPKSGKQITMEKTPQPTRRSRTCSTVAASALEGFALGTLQHTQVSRRQQNCR